MTESKNREQEMVYEGTEAEYVAKCREVLDFLDKNLSSLTPLHFNKKHRQQLKEHISVWRWYLSHSYFKAPNDDRNTPDTKPPVQYLYNLLFSGPRNVPALITLCAAGVDGPAQGRGIPDGHDEQDTAL